jgi:hypothetical protein
MIRTRLLAPLLAAAVLAGCGGADQGAADGNAADEALTSNDEPIYAGDNLTAIDAAANGAAGQPLAPDTPPGGEPATPANAADTAE